MKSTEFIIESDVNSSALEKIASMIRQDCQPYLTEAKPFVEHRNLLRGLGDSSQMFMKKNVRLSNRKPKDIPIELHNKINQYFEKTHGAPFRNAMFCTSDWEQADAYGNVYFIFPIGEFSYLWSHNNEDLFMTYDEYAPWFGASGTPVPKEEQEKLKRKAMDDFFDKEIVNGNWKTNNIGTAIEYGNEIMIRTNSYYAVSEKVSVDGQRAVMPFLEMLK